MFLTKLGKILLLIIVLLVSVNILSSKSYAFLDVKCVVGNCEEGYGTALFADNYLYSGQWKDFNANGQGNIKFIDGAEYFGGWKNGLPDGYGEYSQQGVDLIKGIFNSGYLTSGFARYMVRDKFDPVTTIYTRYTQREMFERILLNTFIIICVSFLCILMGAIIYLLAIQGGIQHPYFVVGAGYFIGLSVLLSTWRTSEYLFGHCGVMLALTLATMLIFVLFKAKTIKMFLVEHRYIFSLRALTMFVLLTVFIGAVVFSFHFKPVGYVVDMPGRDISSLHSGAYANFARYINDHDRIPISQMSYAQSLLAAIPGFMGFMHPFFSLYLWLSLSILICSLMVLGFLRHFKLSAVWDKIGLGILWIGNPALSFIPYNIAEPMLFTSYTDIIFTFASFVIAIIWAYHLVLGGVRSKTIFFAFICCMTLTWHITGAQNIILFGILMITVLFNTIRKGQSFKPQVIVLMIFLIFTLFGSRQGGLLTPYELREKTELPFTGDSRSFSMADRYAQQRQVLILPLLTYHAGFRDEIVNWNETDVRAFAERKTDILSLSKLILIAERNFIESLKTIFFPLAGIVLSLYFLLNKKASSMQDDWRFFVHSVAIIFFFGYIIAFSFVFNEYDWDFKSNMTRFLYPGSLCGMMCFVISTNCLVSKIGRRLVANTLIAALFFIITVGPISKLIYTLIANIQNTNYLTFYEKLIILFVSIGVR
ncbi:MAG: hypothetical protein HY754_01585 [Nitrospirae bacterium]|nr:hypothetical protein [Nitrospirota bacterium]